MSPGRVLVTGGAGFLGSHLCERLINDEYHVLCVDNFISGSRANVQHLQDSERFELIEADAAWSLSVPGSLDAVLHFASPASPADYMRLPLETLKAGSSGTLNALELSRQKDARFILASTSEVYGDPAEHPQSEEYWGHVNPIGPRSVYDEAKRFAEAATTAYRTYRGTNTGIARIFNTYGPRMRPADGRLVPTLIVQALRGQPLTVTGDGSQTRSLCYVDDLVEAIVRFLVSDHAGPMNLGNPDEITVLAAARHIRELAGSAVPLIHIPLPIDDPVRRRPDVSLAQQILGWEPKTDLTEGLLRTLEWFRQPGAIDRTRPIGSAGQ